MLHAARVSVLDEIELELKKITGVSFNELESYLKIQILLDSSVMLNTDNPVSKERLVLGQLTQLEALCRRFVYNIHSMRYKMLTRVKTRRR